MEGDRNSFRAIVVVGLLMVVVWIGNATKGRNRALVNPTPGCTPADKTYEFFELVLQWPPGFGSDIGSKTSHWTIHGLWPSRITNADTYPCTCTNEEFNAASLALLLKDMSYYWPSLKEGNDNNWFWAHEWEKHGTCSGPLIKSQYAYFDSTLTLRKNNDPAVLLGDITPSTKPRDYQEVYSRLSKHGNIGMFCRKHGTAQQTLSEISLCLSASNTPAQFDCPTSVLQHATSKCDPNFPVYILPAAQEANRVPR